LEEAYEGRSTFLSQLRSPDFDPARKDPAFEALEKKVGLYDQ
jgi:hypothetical protein